MDEVDPAEAEDHQVAHELDAVVERVELGEPFDRRRQFVDRKEGSGQQEERCDDGRGDVVEVVDRLGHGRDQHAEARESPARDEADERHQHDAPQRVQAECDGDEQRRHAVDASPARDPEDLGGHQLFDRDGRRQQRIVGPLELPSNKSVEHPSKDRGEERGAGHHTCPDVLDVVDAIDAGDQTAEAEAEGEQVDRRLDDRGERRRLPELAKEVDVAAHHADDGGGVQASDLLVGQLAPRLGGDVQLIS